uniref:Fc receptor-like B n=1 Tax=Lygus hesperus TaxID=30085 RepID=A0A0A9XTD4_LYGHE
MTGSNFNRRWRQIIQQVAILDCTTSCAEDCERSQQCLFWPTVHHHTTIFSTTTLHLVHNFVLALSTFVQYILHHSSVAAPSPSLSTTASALSACPCPCPSASASALSTSMLSISVASPSPSSSSSIGNCVSSGTTVVDDATVASNPPSCSPPHTLLHPFLCLQSHTLVTLKEYYKYAFQSKQPTALQDSDSYPTLPTTTHDGSPNLPVPVKRRFLFRKNPIDITTLQDSLPLRLKCTFNSRLYCAVCVRTVATAYCTQVLIANVNPRDRWIGTQVDSVWSAHLCAMPQPPRCMLCATTASGVASTKSKQFCGTGV